jgi:hypothetical protein
MATKASNTVLNLVSPPIDDMVLKHGILNDVVIGNDIPNIAYFTDCHVTSLNSPLVGAPSGLLSEVFLGDGLIMDGNTLSVNSGFQGHGQCYLSYLSSTQIRLNPYNGSSIISGGQSYNIPSSGIIAANNNVYVNGVSGQNLTSFTTYHVSYDGAAGILKFWNASTYTHTPDSTPGNIGIEVITLGVNAVPGQTYVGTVSMSSGGQFLAQGTGVISWFNKKDLKPTVFFSTTPGSGAVTTPLGTTGTYFAAVWGGGGGGSGGDGVGGGGAGGGGGYAEGWYDATPLAALSYTVGSGGAPAPVAKGFASSGGNSFIVGVIQANGGGGGSEFAGGSGGSGFLGNINLDGQPGPDLDPNTPVAIGGSSPRGGFGGFVYSIGGGFYHPTAPGGGGGARVSRADGDAGAPGGVLIIFPLKG